ncbi:MAG: hypothetical protein ACTSVZ_01125 [Promethearchaeota archaeon]
MKNPTFLKGFEEINEGAKLFSFKTDELVDLSRISQLNDELLLEYGNLLDIMQKESLSAKDIAPALREINIPAIVSLDQEGKSFMINFFIEENS